MKMLPLMLVMAVALAMLGGGDARGQERVDYEWGFVPLGCGGAIPNIIMHPKVKDLIYIQTDVGGCYRWDAASKQWIPLLDWIRVPEANLYGVESMAIDPNDATGNTVYAAIGKFDYKDSLKGEVIRSYDRGKTWQRSKDKVWVAANSSQLNAQRLIVDPHNASILYHASNEGLRRSTDGGETWSFIESAPVGKRSDDGRAENRPSLILADASGGTVGTGATQRTRRLFAGFRNVGLTMSDDGGETWQKLDNAPGDYRRAALDSRGILYITHSKGLARFADGSFTDITPKPSPKGYAAICVDPHDEKHLVTAEHHWGFMDPMYQSHDGGKTWKEIADEDDYGIPWFTRTRQAHRASIFAIAIDPFDRNVMWYVDWTAPRQTLDATAPVVKWITHYKGIEEACSTGAIAAPAAGPTFLYTGGGDGLQFGYKSLTEYPTFRMPGPHVKNTGKGGVMPMEMTGVDFSEADPHFAVFTFFGGRKDPGTAAYTTDGGVTFRNLPTTPNDEVRGGRVTLTADGKRIVWATGGFPIYWSDDRGNTWNESKGLPPGKDGKAFALYGTYIFGDPSQKLTSDRTDPNKVYFVHKGSVYVSTDAATSFDKAATGLPDARHPILRAAPGIAGCLALGLGDDGLYRSNDAGKSFDKVPNVQQAKLVAFGKGFSKDRPALYVLGIINNRDGVYRSDDLGETWVIVDVDNPHPGNQPNIMEGCRQVAGRVFIGTNGRGVMYGAPRATSTAATEGASGR